MEKERKEVEAANRKHLANIRVVQKNLVYVNGLSPKIANDDLMSILRGPEYFGQYGKIAKLVVNKKNASGPNGGYVGAYVTYHRKEDAARAIAAVDGSVNEGRVLRASYGTTKYCTAYLRNQPCQNAGCMYLHEPGEDVDSFTKEDLATIQHNAKLGLNHLSPALSRSSAAQSRPVREAGPTLMESQQSQQSSSDAYNDSSALPVTASWAKSTAPGSVPSQSSPEAAVKATPAIPDDFSDPDRRSGNLFDSLLACMLSSHTGSEIKFSARAVFTEEDEAEIVRMPPFFVWDLDAAKERLAARQELIKAEEAALAKQMAAQPTEDIPEQPGAYMASGYQSQGASAEQQKHNVTYTHVGGGGPAEAEQPNAYKIPSGPQVTSGPGSYSQQPQQTAGPGLSRVLGDAAIVGVNMGSSEHGNGWPAQPHIQHRQ